VRTGALVATLAAATSVAARIGTSTLGGHQIALHVYTFLTLAVDALAIPAQPMIGTPLGAGEVDEARITGRRLVHYGWIVGGALAVAVVALSPLLPRIFSGDPAIVHRATLGLAVVGVMQLPAAYSFVLDGVLMGASDFRFLQLATVGAGLAFAPAAVVVLHWHRLGILGVWSGMLVWIVVRALLNGARFSGERWMASAS